MGFLFYWEESVVGWDLVCLVVVVYKKDKGWLYVLDVLSGCGIRVVCYLVYV